MGVSICGREHALFRTMVKGQPVVGVDVGRVGETPATMRQRWAWLDLFLSIRISSPVVAAVINPSCFSPLPRRIPIHPQSVRILL